MERSIRFRGFFVILLLTNVTVNGWRVVFKLSRGRDLGGSASIFELWNGTNVVNDNSAGFHNTNLTYMAPYQPTYKSSIINNWQQNNIKYVKLGIYNGGHEASYVVFDGNGTDKISWFNYTNIIMSKYTDMPMFGPFHFNLKGSYNDGSFNAMKTIVSTSEGTCTGTGWFTVVDRDTQRFCGNDTTETPYFVYSPSSTSSKFTDWSIGDAFAIFVDDCVVNPCQQDGTCTTRVDGYSCQCQEHLHGHSCQYECPCLQNAQCVSISASNINSAGQVFVNGTLINEEAIYLDQNTIVACQCPQYYVGANCQNTTLQCASSPCLNYGTCVEGYTHFTCKCGEDYTGDICNVPRPQPKETGLNIGGKVALGIGLPLLVIVALVIAYLIYMFKNPDAHGHEATVKQYTIAREFVRRSIRRMSGRRPKGTDDTKDTVAFSRKEKEVNEGQINLAFDDGVKPEYARQNSEYYDLTANDAAVVSNQTSKYQINPSQARPGSDHPQSNQRHDEPPSKFYEEYRPALLQGGSDQYTHPGHNYDEYNKLNQGNPVPQPRKGRQTGRRGRQAGQNNDESYLPSPRDEYPESTNPITRPNHRTEPISRNPQATHSNQGHKGGYDGQVLSPQSLLSHSRFEGDSQVSPRYNDSRNPPSHRQDLPSDRVSPGYHQNASSDRVSPGYRQNTPSDYSNPPSYKENYSDHSNDSQSANRFRPITPNNDRYDKQSPMSDQRFYGNNQSHSPGYRQHQHDPHARGHVSGNRYIGDNNDQKSPRQPPARHDYGVERSRRQPTAGHDYDDERSPRQPTARYDYGDERSHRQPTARYDYGDERSPRQPSARHDYGERSTSSRYQYDDDDDNFHGARQQGQSSDGRIVFTSSEPIEDVTV